MSELYVALIHHPVVDKLGRTVTSSVTNIDVHDIARSCRTYGARAFYVVTPVDALRGLVRRIMHHWDEGPGRAYNPNRTDALATVRLERTLDGAEIDIERLHGIAPSLIATSARITESGPPMLEFGALRERLNEDSGRPVLMLLGTAWGLAPSVLERCEGLLPPICGPTDYNHLSVRAAAAVLLDRLRSTS
ncbi:MAG: hypothetical protein ACI8TX_002521 [Hyphomicrobiaceae bacterium]|jgi:hypothetical protein